MMSEKILAKTETAIPFTIKPLQPEQSEILFQLVKELAIYEKLENEITATEDSIKTAFFAKEPCAKCLILWEGAVAVGYAIYFFSFSTFLMKKSVFLEDLFVQPHYRGKGYGKAALVFLAKIGVEQNCGRMEWNVLRWNQPAIDFYKSLGAVEMTEWAGFRLNQQELLSLSQGS